MLNSYYPLLSVPGYDSWVELSNFSPNNWEYRHASSKFVNLTWSQNDNWHTLNLGMLESGKFRTITSKEIAEVIPVSTLGLISMTLEPLPKISYELPSYRLFQTSVPQWRATIGLSTSEAQTSYQGELEAFSPQGTLLTFGPFIQLGEGISNYLILLNLEKSPANRFAELEFFDSESLTLKGKFIIRNNASNCIELDGLEFKQDELPLVICRKMSAIPLYFSSAKGGRYLSLEHTHPPASLVVQGRRWEAQKLLKNRWFGKSNVHFKKN
jgi:hypothetical protein